MKTQLKNIDIELKTNDFEMYMQYCTANAENMNYKSSYIFSNEELQDIVSDVIEKIYMNIHTFNPEKGKITTWMYAILQNVFRDHLRRKIRVQTISLDSIFSNPEDSYDKVRSWNVEDKDQNVFETIDMKFKMQSVRKLRNRMNSVYFDCLWLTKFVGYSGNEVAKILGISASYVPVYAQRAAQCIRKMI